jgi:DNA recombination protein RmuC
MEDWPITSLAQLDTLPTNQLLLIAIALSLVAVLLSFVAAFRGRGGRQDDNLRQALDGMVANQERFERSVNDAMVRARGENTESARHLREEVNASIRSLSETMNLSLNSFGERSHQQSRQLFDIQKEQHASFEQRVQALTEAHRTASETLRTTMDGQLKTLREENGAKLEAMRMTVDEKLQGTLEQRLGESFKLVSERLDAVHKGLGEMQNLATGVGDLKRVLTNVKARGSWGEVQLGTLLEQILTPSQYVTNAVMAESGAERVEFAIVLPGDDQPVYLPIDAKFPIEDYERLQHASDAGDVDAVEAASRALELRLKGSAKDIATKYVHPPRTTDFAIMFLPTEGLYAEAIRRPGLADELQRTHRIIIAGPTTLTAILSSLQMGFRTLAIQQRSSEVWQVLGAVKAEFGKFGDVLGSVKKKLQEASNHIEKAEVRSRAIDRRLRDVEALPGAETPTLVDAFEEELGLGGDDAANESTVIPSAFLHRASRGS